MCGRSSRTLDTASAKLKHLRDQPAATLNAITRPSPMGDAAMLRFVVEEMLGEPEGVADAVLETYGWTASGIEGRPDVPPDPPDDG